MALLLYCACTMWQLMSFAATLLNQNQTLWKNQDGFLVATVKSALTRFSLNHHHHRIAVVTLKNHQKFILSFVNNFRFPSFHMLSIGAIIVCYDCDVRCMILKTSDINFQPFLSHTLHFTLHIRLLYFAKCNRQFWSYFSTCRKPLLRPSIITLRWNLF